VVVGWNETFFRVRQCLKVLFSPFPDLDQRGFLYKLQRVGCKMEDAMTTHKIILLAGIILSLALPGVVLAGAVNGADWYSTGSGQTTNAIEMVLPASPTVAATGVGMDWYSGDRLISNHQVVAGTSFSSGNASGIGMDWHSEERTIPSSSAGECLASGTLAVNGGSC